MSLSDHKNLKLIMQELNFSQKFNLLKELEKLSSQKGSAKVSQVSFFLAIFITSLHEFFLASFLVDPHPTLLWPPSSHQIPKRWELSYSSAAQYTAWPGTYTYPAAQYLAASPAPLAAGTPSVPTGPGRYKGQPYKNAQSFTNLAG